MPARTTGSSSFEGCWLPDAGPATAWLPLSLVSPRPSCASRTCGLPTARVRSSRWATRWPISLASAACRLTAVSDWWAGPAAHGWSTSTCALPAAVRSSASSQPAIARRLVAWSNTCWQPGIRSPDEGSLYNTSNGSTSTIHWTPSGGLRSLVACRTTARKRSRSRPWTSA